MPPLAGFCSNLSIPFAVHLVWAGLLPGSIKFLFLKHSVRETLGFLRKYLNERQPCWTLIMEASTSSVKLKWVQKRAALVHVAEIYPCGK